MSRISVVKRVISSPVLVTNLWLNSILKSDNLQYITMGCWDERFIAQVSDVPSIISFIISYRLGARVSVQGVESLWGDCRFIPADWGS